MSIIQPKHERCAACNLCVLACSFHHEKAFSRRGASIDIIKDEREGEVEVVIFSDAHDGRRPCDDCLNETKPLCVVWCPAGALLVRED
jgi:Fe-S-cluster-containing dehydrogenase component